MTKTELDNYIKAQNTTPSLDIDKCSIELKTLNFFTCAAIAERVSENVVNDLGEYRPELLEILLLLNILKESAGIEFDESYENEMFTVLNSPLGREIVGRDWVKRLYNMTIEKIEYRKSQYCNPNNLINDKLLDLINKEIETQTATYDSLKYVQDMNTSFTPDQMQEFMDKITEFTDMMKNPEIKDKFFENIQAAAQDERLQKAEKIIQMNAARNVLADPD